MMDWGVIIATLLGPVLAVQAQKFIERGREQRNKQLQIFHTLMATRAIRANSVEHIQALNSIDLFFSRKRTKEKPVVEAWNVYFDHLHESNLSESSTIDEIKRWNDEGGKLLVDLLGKISTYLGYEFDQVQLKRGVYFPRSQVTEIDTQNALRENLLNVVSGRQPLKMDVVSFPFGNNSSPQQNDTVA